MKLVLNIITMEPELDSNPLYKVLCYKGKLGTKNGDIEISTEVMSLGQDVCRTIVDRLLSKPDTLFIYSEGIGTVDEEKRKIDAGNALKQTNGELGFSSETLNDFYLHGTRDMPLQMEIMGSRLPTVIRRTLERASQVARL